MMRFCSLLIVLFLIFLPSGVVLGKDQDNKTSPRENTGEPEATPFTFQPMPVDQRIFQYDNLWFSEIARRIENGSATLPERRGFYLLNRRLYPYDKPVPSNWRIDALNRQFALTPAKPAMEGSSQLATYTWSLLGPSTYYDGSDVSSGRATALWSDPSNKNIIIFGTADGGLWKTTNQGTTWTSLFDTQASQSIGSIGVDPNNSSIIYVGTGEGNFNGDMIAGVGMYKSTDGGSNWTLLTLPAWVYSQPYHNIRRIVVDPRDSQKVYAAVDGGLIYSIDGGSNWTRTDMGNTGNRMGTDVVLDSVTPSAGNPSIVYFAFGYVYGATANGIYRSTSGGAGPWAKISSAGGFPTTNVGRIALVQAPSDRKQIYALIQDSSTFQSRGIYYTSDATAASVAWTLKNNTTQYCSSQCWYDMHGCVDPSNASKILAGGLDVYLSTNQGTTLTKVSDWAGSGSGFSHADHHFIAMPDSTTLYDANDGGFFIGAVSGSTVTWVNKNSGLPTTQFYGFAQHPTDSTKYQGGLQDNGQAYNNGTTWNEVWGGDGGFSAWDKSNANYAYEEYVYGYINRASNMVASPYSWSCIQNFGGCTCVYNCEPDGRMEFIAPFTLDANDQNIMYTGTYRVWKNSAVRTGNTWSAISTDLTGGGSNDITYIHSAKNNGVSGTIYVGTLDGKLKITTDGGTNWYDRTTGLPVAAVNSIATDPLNGQNVLVAFSGYGASHIYRSANGGTSWANTSGSLPAIPFNTIVLDPADSTHAYAGADMGIYENTSVWTGSTWTSITYNLPQVANFELGFSPLNSKLRTATHGRGIWELTISSSPNPKETSPSRDMTAVKGTGTSIDVAYTPSCGADDHTVYTGDLSTLQSVGISWSGRYCNKGKTGSLNFDPGAIPIYFVVVGNNIAGKEGSYGLGTTGERPPAGAGAPCSYTQDLTGTCP